MQKFTRPLTREIEVAGERLALTFTEQGVSVRPVGSRKPPREMSWAAFLRHLADPAAVEQPAPAGEELTAILDRLKSGAPTKPAAQPALGADQGLGAGQVLGAGQALGAGLPTPPPALGADQALGAGLPTPPPPAALGAGLPTPPKPPTAGLPPPPVGGDINAVLNRLETWLGQHRQRYFKGLRPSSGPSELESLQGNLGFPLPPALRALLTWHNGQGADFSGHFEQDWNLMSADAIAKAKRELDEAGGGWQKAWVPFLQDDSGNYVFLDTSQPGNPVRQFRQGNPEQPTAAPSLTAWLEDVTSALERGEYHEDPERGTMLRRKS